MNIQSVRQEIWYGLSLVIMAVVVGNLGLQKLSSANPDLLEIILGSSKLERFAEASGYFSPTAAADSFTITNAGPTNLDVLDNDFDGDHHVWSVAHTWAGVDYAANEPHGTLYLQPNFTNLQGDTGATLTLDSGAVSTSSTAPTDLSTGPYGYRAADQTVFETVGEVTVQTSTGFSGTLSFDYEVCDQDTIDRNVARPAGHESHGGTTPSCTTGTATVEVQDAPNNQPPVINDANVFVIEDFEYPFSTDDFDENGFFGSDNEGYSDPEGVPYVNVRIESLPTLGSLVYNNAEVTSADLPLEIPRSELGTAGFGGQGGGSSLVYQPPENYNTSTRTNPAPTFEFNAQDEAQYAADAGTMIISIGSENDAPVVEDFTVQFAHDTSWYFNMPDDADNNCFSARYSDVDEATRGFNEAWELGGLRLITEPEHGELFVYPDQATQYGDAGEPYAWTQGRVIARDDIDSMRFIPEAGYVGTDTFEWEATDELITESGAAGPAINYAWSNTATTTLNITNTPPSLGDVSIPAPEDTPIDFTPEQFEDSFTDAEEDPLTAIRLVTLPPEGDLTLDGNPVTTGQEVPRDEIATLRFVPPSDYNGRITFDYNATDGYDYAETNRQVYLLIGPVDDVPVASDFSFETAFNTIYSFRVEGGETLFEENFVDPADEVTQAGDEDYFLAEIEIVTLPSNGVLGFTRESDGAEITVEAGQRIKTSELDSVIYAPANGYSGEDSFTWRGYEIDQQEPVIAAGTNLRPQEISNVATASVTVGNYEDLRIVITKDTPDEEVEINKIVCVEGTVTNPNTFALNNVVVRLTTDPSKSPFVEDSFTLPEDKTYTNLMVSNAEFSLTLDRLEAGETVVLGNCVRPLVQDLSTIDGVTFIEGSDRVTQGEVNLQPVGDEAEPVAEPEVVTEEERAELLVRTGGNALPIAYRIGLVSLILLAVWTVRRWRL